MTFISYQTSTQHPIGRVITVLAIIFSFFDACVFITTYKYYGYGSPIELHIFPIIVISMLCWTTRFEKTNYCYYSHYFCGVKVKTFIFKQMKIKELGKYLTIVGVTDKDEQQNTLLCYKTIQKDTLIKILE